jgi:putative membrane protein
MSGANAEHSELIDPRVSFAAERTLLAWIRTGLAMMGFGFVVARFGMFLREFAAARDVSSPVTSPHSGSLSLWFGLALILLGVLVNLFAGWEHLRTLARLRAGQELHPQKFSPAIVLAAVLAVLGVAMAAYLLTVG